MVQWRRGTWELVALAWSRLGPGVAGLLPHDSATAAVAKETGIGQWYARRYGEPPPATTNRRLASLQLHVCPPSTTGAW